MAPLQPVLVLPVYRGGDKFARALASLPANAKFFRRVVISLNGPRGSVDEAQLTESLSRGSSTIEFIQTGVELPWISHQYFWLDFLERTGENSSSWVYWLAHDDQLRSRGLEELVEAGGSWPLRDRTIYLGPWGVRYDPVGGLYGGPQDADVESWTSFPLSGPLRMPVSHWISRQLEQPTYINMSGCIAQLASFQSLRNFWLAKPGGMRIEMATAAAPNNLWVQELPSPTLITYTSPSTDRATYSSRARRDDVHLVAYAARYAVRHPSSLVPFLRAGVQVLGGNLGAHAGRPRVQEEWRRRATVPLN